MADFRDEGRFLTLDYADGDPPAIYTGQAVKLDQLKCQLLRETRQIAGTADRYRGKGRAAGLPGCGGAIAYRAGVASFVVCPSCHNEIDCTTSTALVLDRKQRELDALRTSLAPGDTGSIDGKEALHGAGADAMHRQRRGRSLHLGRVPAVQRAARPDVAGRTGQRLGPGRGARHLAAHGVGTAASYQGQTFQQGYDYRARCCTRPAPSTGASRWATPRA
ncbi:hypothetical protein ACU4GD_29525 [Cupriavidus basilensis]